MKILLLLTICIVSPAYSATIRKIQSPDGNITVNFSVDKAVSYDVSYKNRLLIAPSVVDMELENGKRLSSDQGKPQFQMRSVRETIVSPVPEKRKNIPDVYNELSCSFVNSFRITIRVYNDGVGYRISTAFKDSILVRREHAEFNFPSNDLVYYPELAMRGHQDQYHTSFEEPYQIKTLDSIRHSVLMFTPILVAPTGNPKIVITESDLEEYPGMFLTKNHHKNGLTGEFAPYPKAEKVLDEFFSQVFVSERAPYMARTRGTRDFPWRVIMIAPQDKDLPENDLVYRLASPSRITDVSWIQPRKSTEEWIISANLFNVPFKSGVNTQTYKYYIDFAKRFGFEQVLMDAGWSDNNDLFKITPGIDMDEIVSYARQQNIKIGMWTLARTLEKQLEPALDQFNKWGVDFIMTDFIDRDDQKAVSFYHRVAKACGSHHIMLMFHGAFKPAGFNRTYPHVLTREAVLGSEYNRWSAKATPQHNLLLPFIRMTSGPLDYEPGLLANSTKESFRPNEENVMSMGTRTQQLAMFLVYDSPIQFFSGNPSQGLLEPTFMELMGSLPTTWDTTIVLDARLGNYIVTARKKGNYWYIGAMNDLTPRELQVSLDFLDNASYTATICQDGVNAEKYATDYSITKTTFKKSDPVTIKMAPGGGYVLVLKRD